MTVDVRRVVQLAIGLMGWVVVPAAIVYWLGHSLWMGYGLDYDVNVWDPAKAVLDGRSPYPQPVVSELIHPTYLYPPLLLALDVPLSVLGHDLARAVFWLIEAACVLGGLRLLGVRDWRVLFWAGLSFPVAYGLALGNPTLLLVLPLAAAWRWRDAPLAGAIAVGVIGAFKLFLWPLGLWLIATGRVRAAGVAFGVAVLGLLIPWAAIGFDGLADYPDLLETYTDANGGKRAVSVATLAHEVGLPWVVARGTQWGCALGLLAAAIALARRDDGDRRSFALAVCGALVLSPVVWSHYFALLVVPLAVSRPSFSRAWLVLPAMWLLVFFRGTTLHSVEDNGQRVEAAGAPPTIPQLLVALGCLAILVAVMAVRPGRRPSPSGYAKPVRTASTAA